MIRSAARCAPRLALVVSVLGGVALEVRAAVAAESAPPDEVVVVVGDASPEVAFNRLVDAFGREGWRLKRVRGDDVAVFKHRQQWKGAVLVGPQGSVRVRRPVVHDAGLFFRGAFISVHGQALPSKRKLRGPRKQVLEGVDAELRGYRTALSESAAPAGEVALLRALDALCVTWVHVRDEAMRLWDRRLSELLAYKAKHGNCDVSSSIVRCTCMFD
jgi:hypothetical protein